MCNSWACLALPSSVDLINAGFKSLMFSIEGNPLSKVLNVSIWESALESTETAEEILPRRWAISKRASFDIPTPAQKGQEGDYSKISARLIEMKQKAQIILIEIASLSILSSEFESKFVSLVHPSCTSSFSSIESSE